MGRAWKGGAMKGAGGGRGTEANGGAVEWMGGTAVVEGIGIVRVGVARRERRPRDRDG